MSAPPTPCATMSPRELRVHVINEAGAAPAILDAAVAEANRIWAPAGVRLTWTFDPGVLNLTDGRSVLVIVRPALSRPPTVSAGSSKGPVRAPLGWLVFDPAGRPGSLIEVSFGAIASLVRRGQYFDQPIGTLSDVAQHPLLGRGLGRVVAHELGHWFMGRGHARGGLMQARFGARELIDWTVPHVPRELTAADVELRIARASRCVPLVSGQGGVKLEQP